MRADDRRPETGRPIKGPGDPSSRLPWWHHRVVVVSDDEAWGARARAIAVDLGANPEHLDRDTAATLEGPVGALLIHLPSPDVREMPALKAFASRGWQPLSLVCVPPVRGAARLAHDLDRLAYEHRFDSNPDGPNRRDWEASLGRILDRGGWIVPRFASALGWSRQPSLVQILSLPLLARERPTTVKRWRRDAGGFTYAAFEALFRDNDAPPPKRVLDLLRLAEAAAWATRQRRFPHRAWLASHLGYKSVSHLSRRTRQLADLTAKQLVTRPLDEVVTATVAPLTADRTELGQ